MLSNIALIVYCSWVSQTIWPGVCRKGTVNASITKRTTKWTDEPSDRPTQMLDVHFALFFIYVLYETPYVNLYMKYNESNGAHCDGALWCINFVAVQFNQKCYYICFKCLS